MNSFWSGWIIVLTLGSIAGIWILLVKTRNKEQAGEPHVFDGIEELDNPLPLWWFYLFLFSMVFAVAYLITYPGLGEFGGTANWSSKTQLQKQLAANEKKKEAATERFRAIPVEELVNHPEALVIGQRLFSQNCAACHGSNANGQPGFPSLRDQEWIYGDSADAIRISIAEGRRGIMPAHNGILSATQIHLLTTYVFNLRNLE